MKSGFFLSLDAVIGVVVVVFMLSLATYYSSNVNYPYASLQTSRMGSDMMRLMKYNGSLNSVDSERVMEHINSSVPGRYGMSLTYKCENGEIVIGDPIPDSTFVSTGYSYITITNETLVGCGEAFKCDNPKVIDFDIDGELQPILIGQLIDDEYSNYGLTISADNNKNGHPDKAVSFGSDNPTGGDKDLGTPNEDFSGPGKGKGGEEGEDGENNHAYVNILIIAEDDVDSDVDGYVDDPDDEGHGGEILFSFSDGVAVANMTFIDNEKTDSHVNLTHQNTSSTRIGIPDYGDNSKVFLTINEVHVSTLNVSFPSSGGVAEMVFCDDFDKQCGVTINDYCGVRYSIWLK